MGFSPRLGPRARRPFRVCPLTPPGSACSIHHRHGRLALTAGDLPGLHLVTTDVEAARRVLIVAGAPVSEPSISGPRAKTQGVSPRRDNYETYLSVADPRQRLLVQKEVGQTPADGFPTQRQDRRILSRHVGTASRRPQPDSGRTGTPRPSTPIQTHGASWSLLPDGSLDLFPGGGCDRGAALRRQERPTLFRRRCNSESRGTSTPGSGDRVAERAVVSCSPDRRSRRQTLSEAARGARPDPPSTSPTRVRCPGHATVEIDASRRFARVVDQLLRSAVRRQPARVEIRGSSCGAKERELRWRTTANTAALELRGERAANHRLDGKCRP